MHLPEPVHTELAPLLDVLPFDRAMDKLVVDSPQPPNVLQAVEDLIDGKDSFQKNKILQSGLWLYVDDLNRSHTLSQAIADTTGSFWHGIMHRREGDFSNSHYWFARVGYHPAMDDLDDYDPDRFIDEVARRPKESPPDLVDLQRREWAALFTWCFRQQQA